LFTRFASSQELDWFGGKGKKKPANNVTGNRKYFRTLTVNP